MRHNAINFVAFQLGWLACVLGAANGVQWVGLLSVVVFVGLHLKLAARPLPELQLIVVAALTGLIFDSLLVRSGWLQYAAGDVFTGIAPLWILGMWALFATTFNRSMSWLKPRLPVAILLGAVFGPLSYMAGARMGAIEFLDFTKAILALMFIWALAMPVLMLVARRLDGVSQPTAALAHNYSRLVDTP